ncbi:MAG: exosortase/archaeosortase family protein [Desulfobulbaceae bacterium]|nr:exosortase/archaeosortase family protein [Desulfobulbaceae bacterium]
MPANLLSIKISRPTVLAIGVVLLFIAAYLPALQILVRKWATSEEYGHAFLTVPIILYMIWQKRAALSEMRPDYAPLGLTLVLLATPLYLFALLTEVHTAITLAMLLTITGSLIYLAGLRAVWTLITPLFLLLILIPVPDQLYISLTFPLQIMVSQASEIIIRVCDIPIFREGNIMTVPGKQFEVADACSGLRSMITLLTLSVIMGHFLLKKKAAKLILVAASIPTAIFVNMVRVVGIILLFAFFELDLSEGLAHETMGLVIFLLALLILHLIQRVLESWQTQKK